VASTQEALADIRRSDGKLNNGIVGYEALSNDLKAGFTGGAISAWAPIVAYAEGLVVTTDAPATVVTYNGEPYVAKVDHTATATFIPANWTKLVAKPPNVGGTGDMMAANNLSDLTDTVQARVNLGVPSTNELTTAAESKLSIAGNLVDLDDPAIARANLGAAAANAVVPVGALFWFLRSAAPSGFLVADGSAVTSAAPILRQMLIDDGNPFGVSGSDPLLPNLMADGGRFVRAHDPASGRAFGAYQTDEFKSHTHAWALSTGVVQQGSGGEAPVSGVIRSGTANTFMSAVGGTETRPKNITLLPCIRAA
jgi:hypothetical protein